MTTKYYVDEEGVYLGGFDVAPDGGIEVVDAPVDATLIWDGESWTIPKSYLLSYLATYRYNAEVGGLSLGGLPVPTDDRTKTLLVGAYNSALEEADPTRLRQFKIEGAFATLDNATVIIIALAVAEHVQKCFDAESVVAGMINDDELTTEAEVEEAFDEAYSG